MVELLEVNGEADDDVVCGSSHWISLTLYAIVDSLTDEDPACQPGADTSK